MRHHQVRSLNAPREIMEAHVIDLILSREMIFSPGGTPDISRWRQPPDHVQQPSQPRRGDRLGLVCRPSGAGSVYRPLFPVILLPANIGRDSGARFVNKPMTRKCAPPIRTLNAKARAINSDRAGFAL